VSAISRTLAVELLIGTVLVGWCSPADGAEPEEVKKLLAAAGARPGLCVVLGARDPEFLAHLAREGQLLVHGLNTSAEVVSQARAHLAQHKLYGQVSVEHVADLTSLPYADQLVNLVIADGFAALRGQGLTVREILRVLCPDGVTLLGSRDGSTTAAGLKAQLKGAGIEPQEIIEQCGIWAKVVRPRPAGMDEWTHVRYGPRANRVSRDKLVRAATGPRWVAGPKWWDAAVRSMLAADGRLYYIQNIKGLLDPSPTELRIAAVDAYNGLLLWERRTKIPPAMDSLWQPHLPAVAADQRLYVMFEDGVTALDGATGESVVRYDTTDVKPGTSARIIRIDGLLLVAAPNMVRAFKPNERKPVWSVEAEVSDCVAGGGQVFCVGIGEEEATLTCLSLSTGQQLWRRGLAGLAPLKLNRRGNPEHRKLRFCAYQDGLLVLAAGREGRGLVIAAVSAEDGSILSKYESEAVVRDDQIFFHKGLIWAPPGLGIDPKTGKVVKEQTRLFSSSTCQATVATEQFAFSPKLSITAVEFGTGRRQYSGFVTGGCRVGVIPANGLLYNALQSGCLCNYGAIRGLTALDSTKAIDKAAPPELQKGAAYERKTDGQPASAEDWPTLRHDALRSGRTDSTVEPDLKVLWRTKVQEQTSIRPRSEIGRAAHMPDDRITAPVVANGRLYVAEIDAHRVVALDSRTGEQVWAFTAAGRVDSPPTVHQGLCLFGSRDGWLYCLDASDGQLCWRLRVAPAERRIVAFGQLESVWPAHGSVLAKDDAAFVSAGRSTAAEGGIRVVAVEPRTGRVLWEQSVGRYSAVSLNDILVSDGKFIYLRGLQFNPKTGKCRTAIRPRGLRGPGEIRVPGVPERETTKPRFLHAGWISSLLDGSWRYAKTTYAKGNQRRSYGDVFGQLIAFDDTHTYGFRSGFWSSTPKRPAQLFKERQKEQAAPGETGAVKWKTAEAAEYEEWLAEKARKEWAADTPGNSWVEAMVLADEALFVAGPSDHAQRSSGGGFLWAMDTAAGAKLNEIKLPCPPILDGLIAANGRLYLSAANGEVVCLGK